MTTGDYINYHAECPNFATNGERLLNTVKTSLNNNQLFNTTHYWCTHATTPHNISMNFTKSVYLTQLQVRGNSFSFSILVDENNTVYSDINGVNVSIIITPLVVM